MKGLFQCPRRSRRTVIIIAARCHQWQGEQRHDIISDMFHNDRIFNESFTIVYGLLIPLARNHTISRNIAGKIMSSITEVD